MNQLRNNPFRKANQHTLIDAALIISIIIMTFLYKVFYLPPVH